MNGSPGRNLRTPYIQDIQERLPWVMKPVELIDAALTPRRWKCLLGGFVGSWRTNRIIANPVFRRLNWPIRRLIWSMLWGATVVYKSRPKKVPVPRSERTIRLISAPESYPDFQSSSLIIPSDVPCAEATLPGRILVKFLHLMQDIYPIVTPNQALASTDPEQRLREVYPFMYRLIRRLPNWHSDLVEAASDGNLLGTLAVGGPFAKLLQRTDQNTNDYNIDLRHMSAYPVRDGLFQVGCKINFSAADDLLVVSSIEYDGTLYVPGEEKWEITERIALCSLVTHLTIWRHRMQYHVAGLAPFPVATHNMPPAHPVRRLLAAHISETLSTNFHTHLTLRRNGFDVTGFSFPRDVIFRYYDDAAKNFDLSRLDVRLDVRQRRMADTLVYPYHPQALRYYIFFESFVQDYIDHYYANDSDVQCDAALQVWFEMLDRYLINGIRGYVPSLTKENLRVKSRFSHRISFEAA